MKVEGHVIRGVSRGSISANELLHWLWSPPCRVSDVSQVSLAPENWDKTVSRHLFAFWWNQLHTVINHLWWCYTSLSYAKKGIMGNYRSHGADWMIGCFEKPLKSWVSEWNRHRGRSGQQRNGEWRWAVIPGAGSRFTAGVNSLSSCLLLLCSDI